MLMTNLKHIETKKEFEEIVNNNENVMICCGRMGPMCIPVYGAMERIRDDYKHVLFADMEFDIRDADVIKNLPGCTSFTGLPFTVYFKNGKVTKATSSIQRKENITKILDEIFV